jgi:8-oxo-dGTP pyrophosphatase MutT (NUDIX family)
MITKELAGCVITNAEGRILLIHRNTPQLVQWELPGGKREPHETLEQTAIREAAEEISVDIRIIEKLGCSEFDDDGVRWQYTWFRAEVTAGVIAIGEPDRYDGLDYFDLISPSIAEHDFSINVHNLARVVKNRRVIL